jgi:alkylated DNA repair protein alkB homolog 6
MIPSLSSPALLVHQIPGLSYHEGFLSFTEETELLRGIDGRPGLWKPMSNRKLQNYGGLPHRKGMIPTKMPFFMERTIDKLVEAAVFSEDERPNHALVNRYEATGGGIDPHEDGPVFLPCAAILSLQSSVVMDFYNKPTEGAGLNSVVASIILRPRSLLCIAGSSYCDFLHGIKANDVDILQGICVNADEWTERYIVREQRTSVTIRRCRKTLKTRILNL